MNGKSVSLCMIVKNEEQFLEKCLRSIVNTVDEIIIIDTGSSDRTVEIAESFGSKVYPFKWESDFSLARNYSLDLATSDYILVLDADEYVEEDFDLSFYVSEEKDIYFVNIKNYMSKEYVTHHQAIRLFKNNKDLRYYGKIHEHLNIDGKEELTYSSTELIIHHTGYQQEVYANRDKMNRNFNILLKEVKQNPSGYNLYNLGMQYKVLEDYENALDNFKKSYYLSRDQVYLSYLLYQIGDCLTRLERYEEAIKFLKDAMQAFPTYTGYYFLLGLVYEEIGYLKDAEKCFHKCLELGEVKGFQTIEGVGSYLANIKLSENLQKQGNLIKALEPALKAVQVKKHFVPGIAQYLNVLIGSNIPTSDMASNLESIFPITDVKDLSTIAGVLYNKRSGALLKYLQTYNVEVEEHIFSIAYQYSGEMDNALKLWNRQIEVKEENSADFTAFCIATRNMDLFRSIKSPISYSEDELTVFGAWIKREPINSSLDISEQTSEIRKVLNYLVKLVNKEELAYFYQNKNSNYRQLFLTILIESGSLEEALELVTKEAHIKESPEFLHLLGQLCYRTNRLHDTIAVYNLIYEKEQSYKTLLALYNFYEKIGDQEGVETIGKEMQEVFLLSWKNLY